jgi:hypothetical protein
VTGRVRHGPAWYFLAVLSLLHACLVLAAVDAAPPDADRLITSLEGVYKRRFKSAMVTGPGQPDESYQAEDVIELVRHDRDHLYFRASLQFYNGHSCGLYGIAGFEGGRLVYRTREPGETCTLSISATATDLVLTDAVGEGPSTCTAFCGARGSFRDYRIPLAKRRPIRYLPRLKASRQYKEAVEAFSKAP